jgi:hypothetical protein
MHLLACREQVDNLSADDRGIRLAMMNMVGILGSFFLCNFERLLRKGY